MWEGLFTLLSFCLVMGLASFLAGLLPLSFSLSQNNSRIISSLGTGLLTGTCLIIIIPEGVETLYSAGEHYYENRAPGYDYPGELYEPHAWVSVSLILGFIMMFLIDRLPRHAAKYRSGKKPLHISLANLSQGPHRMASPLPTTEDEADPMEPSSAAAGASATAGTAATAATSVFSSRGFSTTIGLVIHAVADGIALAASTFIAHARTGFIVFLALMIHKAPAAFGLTSVLLKQGLTKRQARAHLLVFSLAAPVGAIITWLFVKTLIGSELGEAGTRFATGILLIFSGGTFLYVAMHTANEGSSEHQGHDDVGNGFASSAQYAPVEHQQGADAKQSPTFQDTVLGVTGMLLPLLAQIGHAH